MVKRGSGLQFVPLQRKLIETYMEIGTASYCEHYTHLWERNDPSPYLQSSFEETVVNSELQNPGLSHFIIYEHLIAVGILKLINDCGIDDYDSTEALLLEKLYLLNEASNKGIGRQALGFVEEFARQLGKKLLWLDTMQDGPALGFYLKNGYSIMGSKLLDFKGVLEARRTMYILGKELQ